jgi:hypothetical protein
MAGKIRKSIDNIGCLTVVGIVFLVLKLLAVPPVAGWSWWIVLAPFWAPMAAALLVLAGFGVVLVLLLLGNTTVGNIFSLKKKNKETT